MKKEDEIDELELVTVKELCALWKIGRTFLGELAECNGFPEKQPLGRLVRWKRKEVKEWFDRRRKQ